MEKNKDEQTTFLQEEVAIDKQIKQIKIDGSDLTVKIKFEEVITYPPAEGEEASVDIKNIHIIDSGHRCHKDFTNAMKKLRKHALAIIEIKDETVDNYAISGIKIDGDQVLKQSRISMTLVKKIKWLDDTTEIPINQISMYDSGYEGQDEMNKVIKGILEEAWAYIGGKQEKGQQLALFPER